MKQKKIDIDPPLMNACGILSYLPIFEYLEDLGTQTGAWITKSIGPEEREGNSNPVIHSTEQLLMNSFALPSMSRNSFEKELQKYKGERPVIISHYGKTPEDYKESVKRFDKYALGHEINISCPNFEPGEESILDSTEPETIARAVRKKTERPVILKLSPSENYLEIAKTVASYADYLCCGNTVAKGLALEPYTGEAYLSGQFGGLSGESIRPVNMRMVHEIYREIKGEAKIIASGGISKPEHIISYARAGASLFQIGTALAGKNSKEIAKYINNLWQETVEILDEMNADSIDEIVGENNAD